MSSLYDNPKCILKSVNDFVHMRTAKMAQWSAYDMFEMSMLGALSFQFPSLKPLVVYSLKKPILMGCYAALSLVTDQIIYTFEPGYFDTCNIDIDVAGQTQNNHDEL